jgi:all-trans-retinol dehydrogenase (NAD+)
MSYFTGKRIVITGVASGLGRGMAMHMARKGAQIIGWDYRQEALDKVMADLKSAGGSDHHGFICDVSDSAAVTAAAEAVKQRVGAPDILINNAGPGHHRAPAQAADDGAP